MDLNNVLWVVAELLFICMNGKAYSGSTKSDVADSAAIGASVSEVLNNVDEIKHRNKKKKPKRDTQNTEISTRVERDEPIYKPSLTSNGVLGYAEDFVLIQHSPDSLRKEIKNDDVIFGDIVACMMSNGYTQHYAVVVNGNGTTVGFGWDASGQKSTDIMGIPYKRVPGYFEYVTANQLSHAYNNKCVLLRNAYTQYYLDIDSEDACIDKLKSKYGEWALTLENRMNSLLKRKLKYHVLECNCQIIASYMTYGFLSNRVNCVDNSDTTVLDYHTRHRSNAGDVVDSYIDFNLICRKKN